MRVVIAEDEALLREGLVALLERAGLSVVASVRDAPSLIEQTLATLPDLVVSDIRMPPNHRDDGLQAIRHLRSLLPELATVVLSQHVDISYVLELLEAGGGGVGYLLKQRVGNADTFCADLERVASGGTVIDPELVAALFSRQRRGNPVEALTDRQREVLALVAEGRSNLAIAEEIGVAEKSVVRHLSHIYETLGILDRPEDNRRVVAVVRFLALR